MLQPLFPDPYYTVTVDFQEGRRVVFIAYGQDTVHIRIAVDGKPLPPCSENFDGRKPPYIWGDLADLCALQPTAFTATPACMLFCAYPVGRVESHARNHLGRP